MNGTSAWPAIVAGGLVALYLLVRFVRMLWLRLRLSRMPPTEKLRRSNNAGELCTVDELAFMRQGALSETANCPDCQQGMLGEHHSPNRETVHLSCNACSARFYAKPGSFGIGRLTSRRFS